MEQVLISANLPAHTSCTANSATSCAGTARGAAAKMHWRDSTPPLPGRTGQQRENVPWPRAPRVGELQNSLPDDYPDVLHLPQARLPAGRTPFLPVVRPCPPALRSLDEGDGVPPTGGIVQHWQESRAPSAAFFPRSVTTEKPC